MNSTNCILSDHSRIVIEEGQKDRNIRTANPASATTITTTNNTTTNNNDNSNKEQSNRNEKRLNFTFQKFVFTILLTLIGGIADTITYTTCGVFCGHITGNFILLPKQEILILKLYLVCEENH